MLVNVDKLREEYGAMHTKELVALSKDKTLSDTAKLIALQELDNRKSPLQPQATASLNAQDWAPAPKARYWHRPSPWYLPVHICAMMMVAPLLKVVGYNGITSLLVAVLVSWALSIKVVGTTVNHVGRMGVFFLPFIYAAIYYAAYASLHALYY